MNGIAFETVTEAPRPPVEKLAIEALTPNTLVVGGSRRYLALKRLFSFIAASAGLLMCAPAMVLIALLIKLDSSGPILFHQERIGLNNRRFRLIKFRSMYPAAAPTSEWARDNAHRITRVGRWLRRFHLDELPQFFNILRGDMDVVGPRPTPLSHHELFEREIPHFGLRTLIRPGLTGWAQIRVGYANDLAGEIEKMRYDLFYVVHQSFALDFRIMLRTIKVVLFGIDRSRPDLRQLPPTALQ
jgi:lipopolysaccharide/colanic/teichoic acid biosynthesis glycosyltransferase